MIDFNSGDRVITTKEGKFHEKGKHGIVNYVSGDILGVVGPEHGKNTLFETDKCRIATPADPGYYGTREEFENEKDLEIMELKTKVHNARVFAVMCFTVAVFSNALFYMVINQ